VGYIFAIKDPRLEEGKNIIYVGNGDVPWESVLRHLHRSNNPLVANWVLGLHQDFPEGLEIVGREIAEIFHGDSNVSLPPVSDGKTRIEWTILAYDDAETPPGKVRMTQGVYSLEVKSQKSYWIQKLMEEGHPLLNRAPGRPRTTPMKPAISITGRSNER
jgi:hypothetical protein